jgi:hypothetical protein
MPRGVLRSLRGIGELREERYLLRAKGSVVGRATCEECRRALAGKADDIPAPFEKLRQYLDEAVGQLVTDMRDQQIAYAVPADELTALVESVAAVRHETVWDVWETWALRHVVPIHIVVERQTTLGTISESDKTVLRKRLRDALGYCILGLLLIEKD